MATDEKSKEELDLESRREFLAQLAQDRSTLKRWSEETGEDLLPYALQAIAIELIRAGVKAEVDLEERVQGLETVSKFKGGMLAGLMGLPHTNLKAEGDDTLRQMRDIAHRTGLIIRESAGLEEVTA